MKFYILKLLFYCPNGTMAFYLVQDFQCNCPLSSYHCRLLVGMDQNAFCFLHNSLSDLFSGLKGSINVAYLT